MLSSLIRKSQMDHNDTNPRKVMGKERIITASEMKLM